MATEKFTKKIKNDWLKALRSGDYVQGKKRLCVINRAGAKYCCMGVLYEVVEGAGRWRETLFKGGVKELMTKTGNPSFYGHGLIGSIQDRLVEMNDEGKDFLEIADYIEKNIPAEG